MHVDVIDQDGVYQNPLRFFPPLADKTAPKIQGIYVVDGSSRVVAGRAAGIALPSLLPSGKYELVLDIIDIIDGAPLGDSVSRVTVTANGTSIGNLDFRDRLPKRSYLDGVKDAYRIEPIVLPDGETLRNRVDVSGPRKFLYRCDLDTTSIPTGADGVIRIAITAEDFAKNATQDTLDLRANMPR